jgi:hypothetical protein
MRRRAIASFIVAGALSACASPISAPATGAEGMSWSASDDGAAARLAFGVPNSDVLVVMFSCAPRSGAVEVMMPGATGALVTLASDHSAARLRAAPIGDMEGVAGSLPTHEPVLKAFARSGRLKLESGGRAAELPAAAPAMVQRYLAGCA